MKTKQEILKEVECELTMKSKTISHIILEGTDGVGKTSTLVEILKQCNYRYVVYDRGELSNFVYAKKYNRPFISLQRNLPFVYVLLTCSKKQLSERIYRRGYDFGDIEKVDMQDEFIKYAKAFKKDFHVLYVDTTDKLVDEVATEIIRKVDKLVDSLKTDDIETEWNKAYRRAYEKLGMKFEVRNNQPYVNGMMFMSESTWQNGAYETFSDKSCPDNLVFSLSYSKDCYCDTIDDKIYDFAYVINSKINRRHEVVDYYLEFAKYGKTCLVSEKLQKAIDCDLFVSMPKVFGDDFIKELSKAKATVYCARDLEYLKLQTCRLYEAIIANQILFVDKQSDTDCEMLKQIHENDEQLIKLLYVTPKTICNNYNIIVNNRSLHEKILFNQKEFYSNIKQWRFGGLIDE